MGIENKPLSVRRVVSAETEHILGTTIERVADMHERLEKMEATLMSLPEMKLMLSSVSSAQTMMAQSAQSMADTFKRAEDRQQKFDDRQEILHKKYEDLVRVATGVGQIPLKSHFWSLGAALLPVLVISAIAVLGVLYLTRYEIKASLDSIEVNQTKKSNEIKREVEHLAERVTP